MKRKVYAEYPPMALLRRMADAYPGCWDLIEDFRGTRGIEVPTWDDWCYAPLAVTIAIASHGEVCTDPDLAAVVANHAANLAALAPWRLSKEVFVLDDTIEQMLYEQAEDADICADLPVDALMHLPYPSFFVELHHFGDSPEDVAGVFIHLEHDMSYQCRELRFLLLFTDGSTMAFPFHLDDGTIQKSLETTAAEAVEAYKSMPNGSQIVQSIRDGAQTLAIEYARLLQIALYICAVNAEITPNPEQAGVTKRGSVVKDKYSEIRKWDVGIRIGSKFRGFRSGETERNPDEKAGDISAVGRSVRPHMRRGHWHHYWTGAKTGEVQRRLILKWVAPTMVGIQGETPVVLHELKAEG